MQWTDEKREQFKHILKTVPNEDVAIITAAVWCKEFNLKFDEVDENISRRWHRYFHTGSLETSTGKLYLYVKTEHDVWIPVKASSTKAVSIWTCLCRDSSFMKFNNTFEYKKIALAYVEAAKKLGIDMKIIEA